MITVNCSYCKKEFKTWECVVRKSKSGVYCSKKCFYSSHRVKFYCLKCNKQYERTRHDKKRGLGIKFCSRSCSDKWHSGKNNNRWKGGRFITSEGYIYIKKPNHPSAIKKGYVAEHRLVLEKSLGRYLKRSERVDHINHDRSDNRLENLKLYANGSLAAKADMEIIKFVKQNFGSLDGLKRAMTTDTLVTDLMEEK